MVEKYHGWNMCFLITLRVSCHKHFDRKIMYGEEVWFHQHLERSCRYAHLLYDWIHPFQSSTVFLILWFLFHRAHWYACQVADWPISMYYTLALARVNRPELAFGWVVSLRLVCFTAARLFHCGWFVSLRLGCFTAASSCLVDWPNLDMPITLPNGLRSFRLYGHDQNTN